MVLDLLMCLNFKPCEQSVNPPQVWYCRQTDIHRHTDMQKKADWVTDRLSDRPTEWPTDWVTDRLSDRPTEWPTSLVWLVGYLHDKKASFRILILHHLGVSGREIFYFQKGQTFYWETHGKPTENPWKTHGKPKKTAYIFIVAIILIIAGDHANIRWTEVRSSSRQSRQQAKNTSSLPLPTPRPKEKGASNVPDGTSPYGMQVKPPLPGSYRLWEIIYV